MEMTLIYNLCDWMMKDHHLGLASILFTALLLLLLFHVLHRKRSTIYLLDYACYKAPSSYRVPMSLFVEHIKLEQQFDQSSEDFQIKILEKSGFGEETCVPPSLKRIPVIKSHSTAIEEARMVIFSMVKNLLKRNNVSPRAIDVLITNSCVFCPTPSLGAMVINEFKMRSNVTSINLSGMGCSAGIVAVGLASDLLRVRDNSLALVVSSETMILNWYTGKNRSMLLTNCLFRMGGAAILMSSRDQEKKAKYALQHVVRTNRARDDPSYNCIYQDMDEENKIGVSISKDTVNVAGQALKANITQLGPKVLPIKEQLRYGIVLLMQKMKILRKGDSYVPDFGAAFEHYCIHAGGRGVILGIEKSLKLKKEDVEPSEMTLYRFGNTSSSSIWYELSYIEAKGRMKKGDRVWQIAVGSGFKCNSAVWKCLANVEADETNTWKDEIHSYPVQVLNTLNLF